MVELLADGRETWVEIGSATYGFRDTVSDVREIVLKSIVDGKVDLLVNNETMGGDPCKGKNKELVVE